MRLDTMHCLGIRLCVLNRVNITARGPSELAEQRHHASQPNSTWHLAFEEGCECWHGANGYRDISLTSTDQK